MLWFLLGGLGFGWVFDVSRYLVACSRSTYKCNAYLETFFEVEIMLLVTWIISLMSLLSLSFFFLLRVSSCRFIHLLIWNVYAEQTSRCISHGRHAIRPVQCQMKETIRVSDAHRRQHTHGITPCPLSHTIQNSGRGGIPKMLPSGSQPSSSMPVFVPGIWPPP